MMLENTLFLDDHASILAAELEKPGFDLAFVCHRETVYYTRFPRNTHAPSSAVIKLLQNIFEIKMDLSFFILRNKIYTTADFSHQDHGMVKLLAKKIQFSVQADSSAAQREFISPMHLVLVAADDEIILKSRFRTELIQGDLSAFYTQEKIENDLVMLTLAQARGEVLHDYDRSIAAVLVDPKGQPQLWALNSNSKNKSLHAEVNLVQGFYEKTQGKIPQGYSIYVTHKPCKMCASMILHACEDPDLIQLRYLNDVTGCRSRWTLWDVLTSKNLLKT